MRVFQATSLFIQGVLLVTLLIHEHLNTLADITSLIFGGLIAWELIYGRRHE